MSLRTSADVHRVLAPRQRSMVRNALEHDALAEAREVMDMPCDLGDRCTLVAGRVVLDGTSGLYVEPWCSIQETLRVLAAYAKPYGRILIAEQEERERRDA
jgi:hypothetical protein